MGKKNVLILTFHFAKNYGALLQAYALSTIIKNLGFNVKFIDYCAGRFTTNSRWNFRGIIDIIYFLKLGRFVKKYFPLTKRYNSLQELNKDCPPADFYVVGSDQVWNLELVTKKHFDVYMLDFVPDQSPKIAYAASFGKDNWNNYDYLSRKLKRFSAISLRESTGIKICSKAGINSAVQVLDPSLLLTDYRSLMTESCIQRTLVCFFLETVPATFYELAKNIAKDLHLKVVILNRTRPIKGCQNVPFPSVGKFLEYLYRSDFIITNSFHGTAFSINFNKNFIVLPTYIKTNSRISSLLEMAELQDHMFQDIQDAEKSKIWQRNINYKDVNKRLDKAREISLTFLRNSLCENIHGRMCWDTDQGNV